MDSLAQWNYIDDHGMVYDNEGRAQALLATTFTYGVTALGAAMVFFFKTIDRRVLDGMLGFAGGVMIAASFWSLLAPSIDLAESMGILPWLPAVVGFLVGRAFLRFVNLILPHPLLDTPMSEAEGIKTNWKHQHPAGLGYYPP
ncbi:hypothetical protein MASR2M78_25950 [Treponema sp.]